jgi:hypothetical protein
MSIGIVSPLPLPRGNGRKLPTIRLYTAWGHYVATVPTLPWAKGGEPHVVVWGSRVFVRHNAIVYVEVFAWGCMFDAVEDSGVPLDIPLADTSPKETEP